LRKLCIGKVVSFEVEETVASIGKSFGHVFLDGQNVAFALVSAGWAKVKQLVGNNPSRTQYYEELVQLEQQAQTAGVGLWSKEATAASVSIRSIITEYDAKQILEALKGSPQELVVEQFRDGATVRGFLLPTFHWVTIFLSGVSCPGFKRPEEPDGVELAEPFAHEARYFVESRLLNRDVQVLLEGVDKYNNFYGSILHPAGSISAELLKVGLGKVVDWSAKFSKDPALLYKCERIAKEQRLRIWKDYQAPARSATAGAAEFAGKVVEIISGDFLVVRDMAMPPVEHKIALSSIKAPKLARKADEKEDPFAWEAREFLRSRLIGRKVTVGIDYIRSLPNAGPGQETERVCGSVLEGQNNVAVALVANGLATVMKHRADDQDRSLYYDDLIQAEAAAARDKKGLHGETTPPRRHINDVSQSSALAQSKQMFSFLQRAGRLQGIVQHVVNGARFKVLVPKESCLISLAIAGVKCPSTSRKEGDAGEPYGEEALQFSRDKGLQHDVEVEVLAQDKIGTMIGRIYVHKRDLAVALLSEGLARLTGRDATPEMEAAQATAQMKRLRTWEKWDAEQEALRAAESAMELVEISGGEASEVNVTEMVDAVTFQVQAAGSEQQLKYIGDRLAAAGLPSAPSAPAGDWRPKVGDTCVAQFSSDRAWYRARVEGRAGDGYQVHFIDYGNSETAPIARLRPIPGSVPTVAQVPAQAVEYRLAYIKPPRDEELSRDASALVEEVLAEHGGQVGCKVEFKERSGRVHATLYSKSTGESISSLLLRAGLAKIERRRLDSRGGSDPAIAVLRGDQDAARRSRIGIWQYGDAVDSDEEDSRFAQDVAAAKAKSAKK
jgi:staphylococcal nuclease domain-containing protein 1